MISNGPFSNHNRISHWGRWWRWCYNYDIIKYTTDNAYAWLVPYDLYYALTLLQWYWGIFSHTIVTFPMKQSELTEAEWRICATVNWASIGSDNGLLHIRCQVIVSTNADLLSVRHLETHCNDFFENKKHSFIKCIWKCHRQNCCHFVSASMC